MPRNRHKPEEIVAKLRQVDVLVSEGQSVADAVRAIGRDRGRSLQAAPGVGELKTDQLKRMKEPEAENADELGQVLAERRQALFGSWRPASSLNFDLL